MTAAQADEPGRIRSREWRDGDGHLFHLLGFNPGDECAIARITDLRVNRRLDHNVTAAVAFTSKQLRELAAEFLERAEVLDNTPARNRKTPNWHIREGDRLLSQSRSHIHAGDLAQQAQAHYLAALAKQGRTPQVVNNHFHTEPSGKDNE